MALPDFSMRQLLEAGVHFGHQKHRWNPKMEPFIFGVRNDVHIIDLSQTVPMLHRALQVISDTVAEGGRVLFVGTKRQAAAVVAEAARQCAQYYVNSRWLGGTLTNWQTISNSISRLRELEAQEAEGVQGLTKKERLQLSREKQRLERDLGGIKDMGNLPSALFVIDTNKEAIAIAEARRLGIPVVAVVDTNSNPDAVDMPVPGNDDAARAIELYCSLVAKAAIDGISRSSVAQGTDLGEAVEAQGEPALAEDAKAPSAAPETPTEAPETAAAEAPTPTAEPETAAAEAPMPTDAEATPAAATEPASEPEAKTEPQAAPTEATEAPAAAAEPADAKPAPAEPEAPGEEGPLFTAPEGEADDLKQISGVGPVLEDKLNALGITTYAQIAAFKKADIEKVDERVAARGRIERDDWVKQAKALAAQKK